MKRVAMILLLAALSTLGAKDRKQQQQKLKPPRIEFVQVRCYRTGDGTISVDGRLRNTGERPALGLQVALHFLASGGEPVTTQLGEIEERQLEPGQESQFYWAMRDHARAVQLKFKARDEDKRELDVDKAGPYVVE